jgi:dihydrofolate reductase
MANRVYIATSLDGYIATSDGGLDWLFEIPNPEGGDYGYSEFIEGIDAIVMGRSTFEKVLTFGSWPYELPVFVLSQSLETVPDGLEDEVEVLNAGPREVVRTLSERGFENLYVDGGKTIQRFLEEDLIDELILTRIPVILGSGIPLFGGDVDTLKFEHSKTEVLNGALVKTWYVRLR